MSFSAVFLGRCGSIQDSSASNTSILLCSEDGCVLVDVSGNLSAAVHCSSLKGVILTHEHIDHVYALPSLLHQLWLSGRTEPLIIAASERVLDIADSMLGLFHLREKKGIFPIELRTLGPCSLAGIAIKPFKTDHTPESYGLVAEHEGRVLVYTSDTRPIHEASSLPAANVLITESSGVHEDEENLIRKGHQSASDAASLASSIKAERLYIVHLPDDGVKKQQILSEARAAFSNAEIPDLLTEYSI